MSESNTHKAPNRGARKAAPRSFRSEPYWLYGLHAVRSAIGNPERRIERAVFTRNALQNLGLRAVELAEDPDGTSPRQIDKLLPPGAVHQGAAVLVHPLDPPPIGPFLTEAEEMPRLIVVLDQVTDPHNVGAILRTAALFGAGAMVCQFRHSPAEGGVLAKTACGAVERVPMLRETNLSRALETLAENGYQIIGLAGEAETSLGDLPLANHVAVVLGAEGAGLRAKTRDYCTALARLDLPEADALLDSLNVSNAAAIALYEVNRKLG